MEYNRTYWQAREGTKLNKFQKVNETLTTVELVNAPDSITVAGTEVTINRLNNMESGITGVSAILESTRSKSGGGIMYNQRATVNLPYDVWDIDIYDDIVFAVVPNGDIYKSTDGGATFSALGVTPRFWIGVAQTRSNAYFITTDNELYQLLNKTGSTLIKETHRMPFVNGICAEGDSLFFACQNNGVYYTEESSMIPKKIFSTSLSINDVCICNGKIYFSCFDEGIYRINGNTATRIAQNRIYRKISGSGDVVSYVVQNGSHYYQDVSKPQIAERLLVSVVPHNAVAHHKDKMITAHTGASSSTNLIPFSFTSYGLIKTAGEITIPGYSTGLYGKPDQGSRRRIYAEAETTITAIGGTTIEGQATMTLSAGHEVELELIGTDWRKVALSQSATPEAGKAMVWPSEASPGTPYTIPTFLVKDMYRAQVEAGSGGLLTVLYDDVDNPSIMRIIPKFRVQDIHADLGTGTHPAFIVNGVEKSEIFIGAFQASAGAGSRAVSIPGRAPWVNINFDSARAACTGKGPGWHMMTNWEWAAISLWCLKNGFQPRGNTDSGRAHDALWETAAGGTPAKTGTGPAGWRHDGTLGGIADLVGNTYEWQDGMKLVDGQIIMPNDNHFAQAESSWAAQGVYFDSTGTTGTDTNADGNGAPILSAARSVPSDDCGNGLGVNAPDYDYAFIWGESGWRSITQSASYNSLAAAVRQRMMQSLIAAKINSTAALPFSPKGFVYARNYGERITMRGGGWGSGVGAGLGMLNLNGRRSHVDTSVGFRPAFIG